jgi:hypothetical protein
VVKGVSEKRIAQLVAVARAAGIVNVTRLADLDSTAPNCHALWGCELGVRDHA